jgi:hypothetical protein
LSVRSFVNTIPGTDNVASFGNLSFNIIVFGNLAFCFSTSGNLAKSYLRQMVRLGDDDFGGLGILPRHDHHLPPVRLNDLDLEFGRIRYQFLPLQHSQILKNPCRHDQHYEGIINRYLTGRIRKRKFFTGTDDNNDTKKATRDICFFNLIFSKH